MKNKSVHRCRFVHHAKIHCIMTTLNKPFKFEFERGGETGKEPDFLAVLVQSRIVSHFFLIFCLVICSDFSLLLFSITCQILSP